jgi:hypothetical protein
MTIYRQHFPNRGKIKVRVFYSLKGLFFLYYFYDLRLFIWVTATVDPQVHNDS